MSGEKWNLLTGIAVIALMVFCACYAFLRVIVNYKKRKLDFKLRMAQNSASGHAASSSRQYRPNQSVRSRNTPTANRQRMVSIPRIEITGPDEEVNEANFLDGPPTYEEQQPPSYDIAIQI